MLLDLAFVQAWFGKSLEVTRAREEAEHVITWETPPPQFQWFEYTVLVMAVSEFKSQLAATLLPPHQTG
jgi:hypothetical protein